MLDFLIPRVDYKKNNSQIIPDYRIGPTNDLMTRGHAFYAIWDEKAGLWTTSEDDARRIIDDELREYANEQPMDIPVAYLNVASTGSIDKWIKYLTKQQNDHYHLLDPKPTFANDIVKRDDYVSKRLPYPLEEGPIPAYERLISTLYSPEERHKLEWAIGSIVCGDSKDIQKFIVMVGDAGTGKSTVIKILEMLFDGYFATFDAKALGDSNSAFALEPLKDNPLVAIQDDADLSTLQTNTRLNSLISHEMMVVNEKFKSQYGMAFRSFIFLGTNKDVYITDARSGLLRRLIDVEPTGRKLSVDEYFNCMNQIKFELGGIAWHCLQVYKDNPQYYDKYTPIRMMRATNYFYNFVEENYDALTSLNGGVELSRAWNLYKDYCADSKIMYIMNKRQFKNELMVYYKRFIPDTHINGKHYKNVYSDFRHEKLSEYSKSSNDLENDISDEEIIIEDSSYETWLNFNETYSIFDSEMSEMPAQYATKNETPEKKWEEVDTRLVDLDTTKLHYVKVPENHIVIDFDLKNEKGEKDFELNLRAASKFPATYAELSKSESGIHLHYNYSGDSSILSRIYEEGIEIKVFKGNSSLRRKLTKCNDIPIATISSGLPLKGDGKMVDFKSIDNEKAIRTLIKRNLAKEYHGATKPSVDFIKKILDDAYNNGVKYDVTDMRPSIMAFANNSTHNSEYCVKQVSQMKFKSDEPSEDVTDYEEKPIIFYDVEVFPNLFIVCWKYGGEETHVVRMINPTSSDIEELIKYKLIGFNNRRYDNHILYASMMGYNNEQLFNLSQRIINNSSNALFGEAYNLSYTDIYDFASAGNKKSLKKLEIEMGIHHQELGFKWDEPVPEDKWELVADYCCNDVIATEAAFNYLRGDWIARQILSNLAGMSVNTTTNTLTSKIIFGNERNPQSEFNYRNLAEPLFELNKDDEKFLKEVFPEMMEVRHGEAGSLLPYFPGYTFDHGVSIYKEEEIGEGGYVYAEPGVYGNVALLDVASMHPHSVMAEVLFGSRFTRKFYEIVYSRVDIKHEDWDAINDILDGKLTEFVQQVINGELTSKELADALKTAINSVYGLTAANFDNLFRDPRNLDNIVAKRGALFMVDLKEEVQKLGYTVAHIKTDSIKIPDADPEIIDFVMQFGKRYGYTFEHEETYDKMCLVNDAVYIARYKNPHKDKSTGKDIWWTPTGAQFAQPYVFKTLFSKEPITIDDMCETKSVTTAIYLDYNESLPADEHNYVFVGKVGQFCPVKEGTGGGILLAERGDKFNSVTGSKGYRWQDSEIIREFNKTDDIDRTYYNDLVSKAVEAIEKYCDIDWFTGDTPYEGHIVWGRKEDPKLKKVVEDPFDETLPFN